MKRSTRLVWALALIAVSVTFNVSPSLTEALAAGSAGIEVGLDSASALGQGNAVVADPRDASTIAYNPAGMTQLEKNQIAMNTTILVPTTEYTSTDGVSEDGSITPAYIPAFFASFNTPIEPLSLGFGVNSPFGLANQYGSDGRFKYTGITSEVKEIAYTLAAAYEVTPWLSVGGGITYANVDLRQIAKLNARFITTIAESPSDINVEYDLDGDGMGWNLGVLVTPNEQWTLGAFYRSSIHASLEGQYSADNISGIVLPIIFGASPSFTTTVDTDIVLPDSITVGVNYKVNEKLDVELDIGWTGWSDLDRFDWSYGTTNAVLNGGDPLEIGYNDTISVNVGGSYKLNDKWTASLGYAYFENAASEQHFQNAFRDGDRHSVATSLEYTKDAWTIALAYAGQWVLEQDIDNNFGRTTAGVSIDGQYSGFNHVILTGITYRFS